MGITPVVLASEPDAKAQWLLDMEVALLPGAAPRDTYLNMDAILALARQFRCSALHPGWGFLSENALFAARCASEGIQFVGPSPAAMRRLGNKISSRRTMSAAGVPILPGSEGVVASVAEAALIAEKAGYPVLLKARSGGGGRGMRRVYQPEELQGAWNAATAEAESGFGDGALFIEKLVEASRHIEFQVLGDHHGNLTVLGERECSVQRRHQKLIEESPSPGVSPETRAQMQAVIQKACQAAGYASAGTVEMLRDPEGHLYFLEMNNRLQVEHPVTEMVTGLDIVELQLRAAANEIVVPQVQPQGHAIECRINAEDPDNDFRPAPGKVHRLSFPSGEGIRIETHLREGDHIPPQYDSMVAKMIVWGPDRATAIARMDAALSATVIEGVPTTIGLHRRVLADARFRSGNYDTRLLTQL